MIDESNILEKEREMFALVNMVEIFDDIANNDYHEVKKKVKSIDNYISMNEIIAKSLSDSSNEGRKQVLKLRTDSGRLEKPFLD